MSRLFIRSGLFRRVSLIPSGIFRRFFSFRVSRLFCRVFSFCRRFFVASFHSVGDFLSRLFIPSAIFASILLRFAQFCFVLLRIASDENRADFASKIARKMYLGQGVTCSPSPHQGESRMALPPLIGGGRGGMQWVSYGVVRVVTLCLWCVEVWAACVGCGLSRALVFSQTSAEG